MIVKLIIAVGAKNVMHQASRPIILAREVPFLQIWAALIMGENFVRGAEGGHCNVDKILEITKGRLGNRRGRESKRHGRSEENTSELQSLMRISNAGFCWKK